MKKYIGTLNVAWYLNYFPNSLVADIHICCTILGILFVKFLHIFLPFSPLLIIVQQLSFASLLAKLLKNFNDFQSQILALNPPIHLKISEQPTNHNVALTKALVSNLIWDNNSYDHHLTLDIFVLSSHPDVIKNLHYTTKPQQGKYRSTEVHYEFGNSNSCVVTCQFSLKSTALCAIIVIPKFLNRKWTDKWIYCVKLFNNWPTRRDWSMIWIERSSNFVFERTAISKLMWDN